MSEKSKQAVFQDARSKKVVFLAHCILNQNARIDTCATNAAFIPGIVEFFAQRQVGIVQCPCPELEVLGLGRQGQDCNVWDGSYRHEDGEVYDQLTAPEGKEKLREMAQRMVYQIEQYRKHGFQVLGMLGIETSPSCGFGWTYYRGAKKGNGAFIEALMAAFEGANLDIPIIGINDLKPEQNLARIQELVE
jgi:predicted secreted protein